MKKLTSLLLSMVLMVSVLACGASAKTSTKVRIAGQAMRPFLQAAS